jgi:uncharacterized membrane protein (UPF0127 family)
MSPPRDGPASLVIAGRLRRLPCAEVLGIRVPIAADPLARLLGLAGLPRERAGAGLLLPCCRSIHTVGMRFALDVVFLDDAGTVLRVEADVPPMRVVADRAARAVLELPARAGS